MTVIDKVKEALHIGHSDKHDAASSASASTSAPAPAHAQADGETAAVPQLTDTPAFDKAKVTVIFVLGGPGAGKGTQCEKLVQDYGFAHFSAGDLLRAEQNRPGSTFGTMISEYIREGKIVPMEVTIKLLENAMRDALLHPPSFPEGSSLAESWKDGKGLFLIDGFPRKMDQAIKFDESVCESSFVLFFSTTEEVMLERLMERSKTSGREDDNRESIVKRFRTFVETSMPVVDYYRQRGKVVEIEASPPVNVVYANVRVAIDQRVGLVASA
ncbi:UMP/CMP kinase [Saitozyma sp. JCM 24511]|nr:UMP/CMP kinase [Saitozyma sp. JCM 24511]